MDDKKIDQVADLILSYVYNIQSKMINSSNELTNYLASISEKFCSNGKASIPHSHVRVIAFLSENKATSISEIAKNLNISKPNMTPIIDNLIKFNLVERIPDENDRRVIRIELTDYAHEIIHNFHKHYKNSISPALKKLSDSDINSLCDSINNISRIVSKLY